VAAPSIDELVRFFNERHPQTVLGHLGVRVRSWDVAAPCVEVDVSERLFQHAGVVHGGVFVLLAESVASIAAALSVDVTQTRVVGQDISATHLKSVTEGVLTATARAVHKGRTSQVYTIDVENEVDGKKRLVSVCRCTMALRAIADG
jgi:uncharacterized protein (TIGR00369 family)